MLERRKILRWCLAGVAAVLLIAGIASLIGNPISSDTWSHQFSNSAVYVNSHRQPLALGLRLNKTAGMISFGRIDYIWGRS